MRILEALRGLNQRPMMPTGPFSPHIPHFVVVCLFMLAPFLKACATWLELYYLKEDLEVNIYIIPNKKSTKLFFTLIFK